MCDILLVLLHALLLLLLLLLLLVVGGGGSWWCPGMCLHICIHYILVIYIYTYSDILDYTLLLRPSSHSRKMCKLVAPLHSMFSSPGHSLEKMARLRG